VKKQRQAANEEPAKVPGYIVTYSDMVTLLLTFFVMLMSLASVQDPELFNKGRGSFVQSVRGLGLGILYGRRQTVYLGNNRIKYSTDGTDELAAARDTDTTEEELRRIFNQIRQSMETMPSQIVGTGANYSLTDIRFSPGDATLNETARSSVAQFAANLRQRPDYEAGTLYIVGLANDERTEKQQWMLSARRAQAAAELLQELLSAGVGPPTRSSQPHVVPRWRIYWWGAGPGGDWINQDGPISKQSQILLAIMKPS
jgi:chemotaxis protein MotB